MSTTFAFVILTFSTKNLRPLLDQVYILYIYIKTNCTISDPWEMSLRLKPSSEGASSILTHRFWFLESRMAISSQLVKIPQGEDLQGQEQCNSVWHVPIDEHHQSRWLVWRYGACLGLNDNSQLLYRIILQISECDIAVIGSWGDL